MGIFEINSIFETSTSGGVCSKLPGVNKTLSEFSQGGAVALGVAYYTRTPLLGVAQLSSFDRVRQKKTNFNFAYMFLWLVC